MASEDPNSRKNKIILGVDDQPENIMMLEALIEGRGYTFFGAGSGAECISLAPRAAPRLILLDIQMPELDGFETCKRLRAIWTLAPTPIVFLTGRKSSDDVRAGMAAGGNDFIVKPFDAEKLLARVDYWTSRRLNAA
jgi:two-component system OmpR family response regulator